MRTLYFKAWDNEKKQMVYDGFFISCDGECFWNDGLKVADIEPLQFTDLKDKNGKEVYEGDVAVVTSPVGTVGHGFKRHEVIYSAPYWMLSSKDGAWGHSQGGDAWWASSVEIIGNIYENPELLNEVRKEV